MTIKTTPATVRVLPLGRAKVRTNDGTGQKAPEDEFLKYNHN